MVSPTPKGLRHFPVSKLIIISNVVVPVLVSMLDLKYAFYLSFEPFIFSWGQYWRLLINPLSFSNESQVFFSSIVFYEFLVIEQYKSSHNFLSFLILVYALNVSFMMALNFTVKLVLPNNWNLLQHLNYATGPLPIIGALLFEYSVYIPTVYRFEITDILPSNGPENNSPKLVLTDKFFVYMLCLQLALSEGVDSVVPFITGWFLGFLIDLDIVPEKYWRVPFYKSVYKFFYKPTRSRRFVDNTAPAPLPADDNAETADNTRQGTPESDTEPVRPLTTQFFDSLRR